MGGAYYHRHDGLEQAASDYERLERARPDFWGALEELRKSHALGDLDVDEMFEGVRDRAPGREVEW